MEAPQSYSFAPIPSVSTTTYRRTTSAATSSSTARSSTSDYSTSRNDISSSTGTDTTSDSTSTGTGTGTAATTTTPTTTPTTSSFAFTQLAGNAAIATAVSFPQASVIAADYGALCPNGSCFEDCQNVARVFQAVPSGISANEAEYGKASLNGSLPDLTLFGLCSNLGAVSSLATSDDGAQSIAQYFPTANMSVALNDVAVDLSICFADTCQATRDPKQCFNECSFENLQSGVSTLSVDGGVYDCMYRLCHNTCGLPYANQDVYGVGVLASYITQAILIFILAIVLIVSASRRLFRQHDYSRPSVPKKLRESMETFLSAQCYFAISAVIASYFLGPATIDPLNGYALLSIAITGFLPTTFTLLLLHSHGVKSWYSLFVTTSSWLFSSVLFFLLIRNLSGFINPEVAVDEGLNALFSVESCGGQSAMSLCMQTFDTNPVSYLSWFYNWNSIPSIRTVPILWVLSTTILIILAVIQLRGKHENDDHKRRGTAIIRLSWLSLGTVLFTLALAYQALMVKAYTDMDVINWNGWSFGQVVALLFWIPPLLDCSRIYWRKSKKEKESEGLEDGYSKLGGNNGHHNWGSSPWATAHSPTSGWRRPFSLQRTNSSEKLVLHKSTDVSDDFELRRIPRKPVVTT